MSIQIFRKIIFCKTFEDLGKISDVNTANTEIINYEYLKYSSNEISGLYKIIKDSKFQYQLSNCNIGFLHFNGYIPEYMRYEILDNIQSKKFFEQMHNIMLFQYIKFVKFKYDNKVWFQLIKNIINPDILNYSNINKRIIYSSKSTFNVRQQSILDVINSIVDINQSDARIEKHHIFKIEKKKIPYLGIFQIGSNTIGSHYYTSMCAFIYLSLSSLRYNEFIKNIKKILQKLKLQAPEFKIVFVIKILDAEHLNFRLGSCQLSLSSWIINNNYTINNLINIIF